MSAAAASRKRHPSERLKGGTLMLPRWSTGKAVLVGFLAGRGWNATEIADHLGDGTIPATVRAMWKRWRFKAQVDHPGGRVSRTVVLVDANTAGAVHGLARARGLSPAEWTRRVCVCAIEDDLYRAVCG